MRSSIESITGNFMQCQENSCNIETGMLCGMLTSQRRKLILERLKRDGQIIAKSLSVELELSEDTIRRDLRELAQEGLLQRVHGGALPASSAIADFATRQTIASNAKSAIGAAAARTIEPGSVVIVDGGTTAVQLIRALPQQLEATIVTHSPSIAVELIAHPNIDVILIGGRLFKHSVVAIGAVTIAGYAQIRADLCFVGVTGLHPDIGLTTGDLEEAHIKRAMIASAGEVTVMTSSEKLLAASSYVIAPISAVSAIITELSAPIADTQPFERLGISVTRA